MGASGSGVPSRKACRCYRPNCKRQHVLWLSTGRDLAGEHAFGFGVGGSRETVGTNSLEHLSHAKISYSFQDTYLGSTRICVNCAETNLC
jgi:hypothetical protein